MFPFPKLPRQAERPGVLSYFHAGKLADFPAA